MLAQIFERNVFKNEFGIAIAVGPNAGKVYDSWGFDLKAIGGVEGQQVCSRSFLIYPEFYIPALLKAAVPRFGPNLQRFGISMESRPDSYGKIP